MKKKNELKWENVAKHILSITETLNQSSKIEKKKVEKRLKKNYIPYVTSNYISYMKRLYDTCACYLTVKYVLFFLKMWTFRIIMDAVK